MTEPPPRTHACPECPYTTDNLTYLSYHYAKKHRGKPGKAASGNRRDRIRVQAEAGDDAPGTEAVEVFVLGGLAVVVLTLAWALLTLVLDTEALSWMLWASMWALALTCSVAAYRRFWPGWWELRVRFFMVLFRLRDRRIRSGRWHTP